MKKRLFRKLRKSNNNIFIKYSKNLFLESLDHFVNDHYSNNLIFFGMKITIDYENYPEKEILNYDLDCYIKGELDRNLARIELIEYVYVRKKDNNIYVLILVKSILGYNDCMMSNYLELFFGDCQSNFNLDKTYLQIKHFKNKKDIKRYFRFLVEDYNPKTHYQLQFNKTGKSMNGLYKEIVDSFLYNFERSNEDMFNLFVYLELNSVYFLNNSNQYNSEYIYSVKQPCKLSIINMWNIYMLMNNVYYNRDDKKLYSNIEKKFVYFSELSYLKENIRRIYWYLTKKFSNQFFGYPIEELISEHSASAYEFLLLGVDYLIPTTDMELVEKEELIMKGKITLEREEYDEEIMLSLKEREEIMLLRRLELEEKFKERYRYENKNYFYKM